MCEVSLSNSLEGKIFQYGEAHCRGVPGDQSIEVLGIIRFALRTWIKWSWPALAGPAWQRIQ